MAETAVVTNMEVVNAGMEAFALRQSNWINARVLAASTAESSRPEPAHASSSSPRWRLLLQDRASLYCGGYSCG